ncbi:hypothetical protein M8J75_007867 [Diaphorina citri]|nr:hypothetical protein M8J75_007867 [Diaphorina citri]
MSETRSSSALFKRAEQLKRWEESETNRQPSEMGNKPKKIKFSSGCVFLAACASSDKEEVLNLLKSGADINTANVDGLTALHQACIDNNLDMVEFLVENHADVNRGDNEGWTPLHATASCGFLSIAKYLIEHSANVAACNNDGELAIDIAESDEMEDLLQRHIELQGINPEDARTFEERSMLEDAKFWLSSGCLGDVPNPKTGASALHVAAAKGYIKVMNILIQAGADLNFQDYDGWTPLHAAAHWAQREACQILVENFCDMDVKNYVGQTCFDIADVELVSFLEDLRKKQASMERSQQDINNIASKQQQQRNNILPKRRLSSDRSPLSKAGGEAPHTPSGGGDGSVTIGGEEDATPADKMAKVEVRDRKMDTSSGAPGGGDRNEQDLKNRLNREDTSPKISPSATNASAVTNSTNSSSSVPSNNNNNAVTSPNLTKDTEVPEPPSKTEGTPPDVSLRRTRSFEADEKFLRRYLELRAKINAGNSCPSLVNPPTTLATNSNHNTPTRTASLKERPLWRRGVSKDDTRVTSSPSVTNTTNPSSPPSSATTSPQHSLTTSVRSVPTTPTTPTTPGGSKLSPSNIFKNFFKSFVPPVRDEESETQRKAHAKRVRETRRSTQGVTLEELKSAEQLVKKKQQQQLVQASQQPSPEKETPDTSEVSNSQPVAISATITPSPSPTINNSGERRPSWRLRVDNGVKFMLEDARDNPSSNDKTRSSSRGATDTAETTVTIPLRRPGKLAVDSDKEQDKENDSRNAQATQAVIQRRKRPKRRSTGVVHVDLDEILDRGGENEETNHTSRNLSSYSSGLSSSTPYLNSSYPSYGSTYGGTSSGYGGLTLPSSYSRPSQSSPRSYHAPPSSYRSSYAPTTTPLPPVRPRRSKSSTRSANYTPEGGGRMSRSGSTTSLNSLRSEAPSEGYESGGDNLSTSRSRVNSESGGSSRKLPNENGELDYKKLYEESQAELSRLRETLSKTEEELNQVKATYSKNSLSEQEKRERRTMERKLSEMEVELKELDQFKKENQRLKDENGALIRVISKLSK